MASTPGRYDAKIDLENENDSHVLMIRMVGGGKRVLDVGCWNGDMGSRLRANNREVVGLEKDSAAAAIASERLDRVVCGDIEELDLPATLGQERFDAIVLGDVLEHLSEPGDVLRRLRPLLAPGGSIVASIPNVAHGSIRLNLLNGEFRYTDVGLLDRTHLRFFTRRSLESLFEEAGWVVVESRTTTVDPLAAPEGPITPDPGEEDIVARVQADPDAHVYQFVVRAVPDDADHALRELRSRERALEEELAHLRRTAAGRRHGREHGLRQLALVGNGADLPDRWCQELLQLELGRRRTEGSIALLRGDDDPGALRWADAIVLVGARAAAPDGSAETIALDLSAATLADIAVSTGPALAGVALHARRARKAGSGVGRMPMLRLLGVLPADGDYVVVAVDQVEDREGFETVLRRLRGDGTVIALPLALSSTGVGGQHDRTALPSWLTVEDVVAVLDGASGVITTHPAVALMAYSLGRPHALLGGDHASATLLATVGGGAVTDVSSIDAALFRTSGVPDGDARGAAVAARVDDVIDAAASQLDRIISDRTSTVDPAYVENLEASVAALQGRLVEERTRMAQIFDRLETERSLDAAGAGTRTALEQQLRDLRAAADTYRRALAELQEHLHAVTRRHEQPVARAPMGPRRIAGGVARRLGFRRR